MRYVDIDDALGRLLSSCLAVGDTVTVRGSETKELLMESFTVANPLHRVVYNKHRKGNIFAVIAETLWVLAGRNDLDWLEQYIPQCKKWSDDGKTWRAAYGPRLRNWNGVDQIAEVMKKLQDDPYTRQAVITIWNPSEDWVESSKDYPCNNWLHFIIRDNELHLNVVVRSNDLIYGFSHVDFFCWSVLQQLMAYWLQVRVGTIGWNVTSLHIYKKHYKKADKMCDDWLDYMQYLEKPNPPQVTCGGLNDFDQWANVSLDFEVIQRDIMSDFTPVGLLHTMRRMLVIYQYYKKFVKAKDGNPRNTQKLTTMVDNLPDCDMKTAAIQYFQRVIPTFSIT